MSPRGSSGALCTDPRESPQGCSGRAWRGQGPCAPAPATGAHCLEGPWDTADLLCVFSSESRFTLQVAVWTGKSLKGWCGVLDQQLPAPRSRHPATSSGSFQVPWVTLERKGSFLCPGPDAPAMGPVTHSLISYHSDPPLPSELHLPHTPSLPCWTVGDSETGGEARAAPPHRSPCHREWAA